jgi:dTDP-glucose 4,6-dehydratase
MRALVTGAGGFIGSHLVEALVAAGAEVSALVRYNAEGRVGNLRHLPPGTLARVRVVPGDLNDAELVHRLVAGCDTVFHLGALIAIPHSYAAPRSYVTTNIVGTLNVLEAVRAARARLIHTSTSEVYGSARAVPMDEGHPLQAQSPYAATKIAAEKLVESYARSFGVRAVVVRPFNTFGPRQSARAIVPTIIGQALAGDVVRLGALTPVRDLTYVSDTVAGLVAAAALDEGCFNLGTGAGVTIADLAQLILGIMGVDARIEADPQRLRPEASEVDRLVSSHAAFTAATGWTPRVALEDGLRRSVEFFAAHPELLPAGYAV